MARPACLVSHLLVLTLLCCTEITFAKSPVQAEEPQSDGAPMSSVILPAVAPTHLQSPNRVRSVHIAQNTTIPGNATIPRLYQQMLNRHNSFRTLHGVANLTWDAELALAARRWAKRCVFEHNSLATYGENIYAGEIGSVTELARMAKYATVGWYSEIAVYDYSNPGFADNTGHFTQIVWKATTSLGCWAAACPNLFPDWSLAAMVVCNYAPSGNFGNAETFTENVPPPIPR